MRNQLFATLLVVIVLFVSINCAVVRGDYSITVHPDKVSVAISLLFQENVTALPKFNGTLLGVNSSSASFSFQQALRQRNPAATLDSFELTVKSSANALNDTVIFSVGGVTRGSSQEFQADLGWKSFNVTDEVLLGSHPVNHVGSNYILSQVTAFTQIPIRQTAFSFTINGINLPPAFLLPRIADLSIMDFSDLSSKLDAWDHVFDFSAMTTSWAMKSVFVLAIRGTSFSPEGNLVTFYQGSLIKMVRITAPGLTSDSGDTIFAHPQFALSDLIMLFLIVLPVAVLIVSLVFDRRISGTAIRRRQGPRGRR